MPRLVAMSNSGTGKPNAKKPVRRERLPHTHATHLHEKKKKNSIQESHDEYQPVLSPFHQEKGVPSSTRAPTEPTQNIFFLRSFRVTQDKKKWDFSSCQLSHKPRCSGPRKGWGMPTVWSLVYGPPLSGINTTQHAHPLAPGQQSSFHPPSFAEVGQPATILISQIPSQVKALGQREIGKETCKNEDPKRPSENKLCVWGEILCQPP